ncbi:hypothetical protein FVEG_17247 [Fusarium verticillioides 7600]|uniref:Uncharacterized protein n=1 Tax=Gibberella moniliformis (strain M3125 / FGSC 7600) TaxID=334819 RepID=W7N1W8_GIBM7|nr:hypothetical protein FVEG_17247 [Fusarium verticillioides 7600]EWG54119.1 hypothetical protein FVEG_17247 [Fusarium verticillioides 7600]
MPARSTQVNIENHSSQDLHGGNGSLLHGMWSVDVPDTIPKGQSATGEMTFHFDNPFIGNNSYDTSGPDSLSFSTSGGEGNNCIVTLTISDKVGHGHK